MRRKRPGMVFPYLPDDQYTGDRRWLPRLPVTIREPASAEQVVALVDSGSEQNVFGADLADRLKISLSSGKAVTIVGVGGGEANGQLVVVELQLGTHRWAAPTIFASVLNDQPGILGRAGFFAFFTVTFREYRRELAVRRHTRSASTSSSNTASW
ncbi:MAG: retroviral-like aspartic protease [Planctomycetes bacterium]|nr:retroviral-like aspartic protease [Planctomycetota bacterium]